MGSKSRRRPFYEMPRFTVLVCEKEDRSKYSISLHNAIEDDHLFAGIWVSLWLHKNDSKVAIFCWNPNPLRKCVDLILWISWALDTKCLNVMKFLSCVPMCTGGAH